MTDVPVREGLYAVTADGPRLLGGRCPGCGRWHFPAAPDCPYCGGERCAPVPCGARGTLCLFTTVHARPPGYLGELPFGFGVVELPEGLRVITRLTESDPARLRPGLAMRLAIVPLHVAADGGPVVTFAYAPAETGGA